MKYDNLGNSLATCGGDCLIKIWDPKTGKELMKFKDHTKPVTCVDFTFEGNLVVGGSVDKTVRVFDMKTQRLKHTFTGHQDTVNAVAVMTRQPKVVSGGGDRTIKLWDLEKFQIANHVFSRKLPIDKLPLWDFFDGFDT